MEPIEIRLIQLGVVGGDFLVKVKKRAGQTQNFDKAKLKRSLMRAGATEAHATKCADTVAVKVREGMTTAEIKRMAAGELGRLDRRAADTYLTFKKERTLP